MKIVHWDARGKQSIDLVFSSIGFYLEQMLVQRSPVERMNYVLIIGFITHVNVNLHSSVNNVIKVRWDIRCE